MSGLAPPVTARKITRVLLALAMASIGVLHFVRPDGFVKIVPRALPYPYALVLISGAFEILLGLGLLLPRLRRISSYGLVALYLAVFPANINMAIHRLDLGGGPIPTWALWARLPFQLVFIALALWVGRPDQGSPSRGRDAAAL